MSYDSPKYCIQDLYANVAKDVENHQIFTDLYVGIAMNVKKSTAIMGPICRYCNECKKISNHYATYMWVLHI
jgi:hypothetical protein